MEPKRIGAHTAIGIEVDLPKTHLAIVRCDRGYIMCGALDVELLSTKLKDRHIVAGRAVGVKTVDELLEAPLESVTDAAKEQGWREGMRGRDALERLMAAE